FPDWKGTVYPRHISKDRFLNYYENDLDFNTVELNFTYYAIPSPDTMISLTKKTSDKFEFVIKLYKGVTHDPFDYRLDKKPDNYKVKEYCEYFNNSIRYIRDTGKLPALLLQFPVFFYPSHENTDYILNLKELLKHDPIIIEFRNSAWLKKNIFKLLKENNIGYCSVDEPELPRLMPFVNEVTSDIAYMRFHGRNKNWFNAPVSVRYDYLYSKKELENFLPEIKKMDSSAEKTFIFFNNCHSGSAATNAKTLKDLLGLS
ncbi:DUF72 domain-containing protein, partial [Elusimicrobiota bacterium]